MAASASLLPVSVLFIIAVYSFSGAAARPCKTLLISSYTFSVNPLFPNPNSDRPSSSGFVTIVTDITQQRSSSQIYLDRRFIPVLDDDSEPQQLRRRQDSPLLPFGMSSSLRDRTKDILSVVVALLFGVGCGALTAASMYLVWSLFAAHRYDEFNGDDEDVDDDDEDFSPKKIGYVKIPEADSVPKQFKDAVLVFGFCGIVLSCCDEFVEFFDTKSF